MSEKSTSELENTLGSTHIKDFTSFLEDNKDSMLRDSDNFYVYIKELLHRNKVSQQEVFLNADIPERYGYKLLSGEKRTKQRDIILRICYAANMTLEETQKALKRYEMPQLFAKIPRDAFLMIIFNEHPGNVIDVNSLLKKNGMEPLRSCGVQE